MLRWRACANRSGSWPSPRCHHRYGAHLPPALTHALHCMTVLRTGRTQAVCSCMAVHTTQQAVVVRLRMHAYMLLLHGCTPQCMQSLCVLILKYMMHSTCLQTCACYPCQVRVHSTMHAAIVRATPSLSLCGGRTRNALHALCVCTSLTVCARMHRVYAYTTCAIPRYTLSYCCM